MGKIKEIKLSGFKGNTLIQQVTGKDIFIGKNGAGKSSRIQAMLFSLLGYIPGQSKVLNELFKFSSNDKMTTGIKADSGFTIERSIQKKLVTNKKNGEIEEKLEEDIVLNPSLGEKNLTQKKARILSELGDFPVMLNFQEFIDKSDMEKRKFIYNLTQIDNSIWNKKSIYEYLEKNLLNGKENENLKEEIKSLLFDLMKSYPEKCDVEVAIKSIIDTSTNKKSYWEEEKKITSGTLKKLAEFRNLDDTSVGSLVSNQKQLDEIEIDLVELQKSAAANKVRNKEINNKKIKIKKLKEEIEMFKKTLNSQNSNKNSLDRINKEISQLKNKIISPNNIEKIKNDINTINKSMERIKKEINEKEKALNKTIIVGKSKKSEILSYEKLIESINKQQGRCVISKNVACNKNFSKFISHLQDNINKLSIERNKCAKEYKDLKLEVEKLKGNLQKNENEKENLINKEREINYSNNAINSKISNLSIQLNNLKNVSSVDNTKLEMKMSELNSIESDLNEYKEIKSDEKYEKEINNLKVKAIQIRANIDTQKKVEGNIENFKRASIQNKRAQVNICILTKIIKELGPKGLQGKILKDNLNPIKNKINENLKILGIDKEFFFQCTSEKGKEVFKFGWIKNHEKVDFQVLSDGEKTILLIAFLTAIIEKRNPPVKILAVDKIEAIDEENLLNLLKGLNFLSNKFDNIILCGRILDKKLFKVAQLNNFTVHNLDNEINTEKEEDIEEAI